MPLARASDAHCVSPSISGCFETIQSAVDAAAPHDSILVHPHPDPAGYEESVIIYQDGLRVLGLGLDGFPFPGGSCPPQLIRSRAGDAFVVVGSGVTIRNFTVQGVHPVSRQGKSLVWENNCVPG